MSPAQSKYEKFTKLIVTFFYLGYLPLIPGTFGSLAGLFLYYLLKGNLFFYLGVTGIILFFGFLLCGRAEEYFRKKDPRYIVIDEVAGMLISLLFLPVDIKIAAIAFFLFRLLDTLKPYPASIFQKAKGSIGIMGDDIVCALYTNLILQVVFRLASSKTS